VVGKPAGILLFSFLTVKLKIASLPENVTWLHMVGAAILGGVGFTMAIFVANLAFADAALITQAKFAILAASAVSGIMGFLFLYFSALRGGAGAEIEGAEGVTGDSVKVAENDEAAESVR
jgi:NhaA family Na+:H+ antiporter